MRVSRFSCKCGLSPLAISCLNRHIASFKLSRFRQSSGIDKRRNAAAFFNSPNMGWRPSIRWCFPVIRKFGKDFPILRKTFYEIFCCLVALLGRSTGKEFFMCLDITPITGYFVGRKYLQLIRAILFREKRPFLPQRTWRFFRAYASGHFGQSRYLFQFLYQERHIPSGVEFHQPGQSGIRRQKSQEPNPCPEIGARLYPTTNVVFHIKTSISWCRGEGR